MNFVEDTLKGQIANKLTNYGILLVRPQFHEHDCHMTKISHFTDKRIGSYELWITLVS